MNEQDDEDPEITFVVYLTESKRCSTGCGERAYHIAQSRGSNEALNLCRYHMGELAAVIARKLANS